MPVKDVKLDNRMLTAHDTGDIAALVQLYQQAAVLQETKGNDEAACFYLTHAYVFALEQGDVAATELHNRLKVFGREE